jgi:thiamine kinase-like enzyme
MINNFKLIKDLKPGTVFLVEDEKGERFVLKQGPAAGRLVAFSQMVQQKGGELAEIMPVFFARDDWFWQKYLTWELAGDTVETYGIKREAFTFVNPEKLARAVVQLQKAQFSDPNLEVRRADFYLQNTSEFRQALTSELSQEFADKVGAFLVSGKDLVDRYSHFLANGDLHPQNLMYQGDKFVLVDWDLLHLNNPGWDLTDLYVWGWRDSNWEKRLLKEYEKAMPTPKSIFEKIFAFDVVYLSSQLIKHAKLIKAPQEFLEAQKKFLQAFLS